LKEKIFSLSVLILILSFTIVLFIGCGDGGLVTTGQQNVPVRTPTPVPSTDFTTNIETVETNRSGDYEMSGYLKSTGRELELHLIGILNPNNNNEPITDLTVDNFTIQEIPGSFVGTDLESSGYITPSNFYYLNSNPDTAIVDIAFVFDNSGSMAEEIGGIASSVSTFAQSVSDAGVDAQFGLAFFGNAFNTKTAGPTSIYAPVPEVVGDFPPQTWDGDGTAERPRLPLGPLDPLYRVFNDIDPNAQSQGSGDTLENGAGTIQYVVNNLNWRTGSQKVIIVVTDAMAHTPEDFDAMAGTGAASYWRPPSQTDLLNLLIGNDVVVHTVTPETPEGGGTYNMGTVADASGGRYIYLPTDGNVDLIKYKLDASIAYASILTWVPTTTTGTMSYYITITYNGYTGLLGKTINYYNYGTNI